MSDPSIVLTAVQRLPVTEQSRGLVRLGPQAFAALDLAPLDIVRLAATRATGALAAPAAPGTPPDVLLCDELLLANLGATDGAAITVQRLPVVPASAVRLAGPPEVVAVVDPALLRSALHGKVITAGDVVSLLPHDLPAVASPDREQARRSLRNRLLARAGTERLSVVAVEPPGPALVGAGTAVGWAGGPAGHSPEATAAGPPAGPAGVGARPRAGSAGARRSGGPPARSPAGSRATAPAVSPTVSSRPLPARRVADLPGLEEQAHRLREWLDLGFFHPDLLARLGSAPQMGVLVAGPAGSGKASLVAAVAAELDVPLLAASGSELAALAPDAAAEQLRALLAERPEPAVVLLEDVEALAPREAAGPVLPTLLRLVAAAIAGGRLAVVCTTSRPEQVARALTAPGVLEHELVVPLPDRTQRRRLLAALTEPLPLAPDVSLDDVAARTPGFVAADLAALLRAAGLRAAARQREAAEPVLSQADLDGALQVVRPTAVDTSVELGGLTLDDVGDLTEVKATLTEAVLWPLRYPETFATLGVAPPRGVLLYGPPGGGKTFLVRALAGSGEATVLSVKGAELLSKWVGESERAVRELFRRARETAPALVFLDEVDALAPVRGGGTDGGTSDRVVAALLTELDGVEQLRDVVVVGATNRPDRIDPALLRPGRLERLVYLPPPDAEARGLILRAAARRVPLADDVDLGAVAARTDGFSAADCAALVREAALVAMRESLHAASVTAAHLEAALRVVRPSLDPAQVAELASYAERRERG